MRGVLAGDSPGTVVNAPSQVNEEDASIFYVGYYSQHEQSMQEVIRQRTIHVEEDLSSVLKEATVHCRRDYLWQKMFSSKSDFDFEDLLEVAELVTIEDIPTTALSVSAKFSSSYSFRSRYQVLIKAG